MLDCQVGTDSFGIVEGGLLVDAVVTSPDAHVVHSSDLPYVVDMLCESK